MDNAYYTGATLIRAGNNGGGSSKYLNNSSSPPLTPCQINVSTSLAGPPLLIQPNLLTGLPLIRNAQHHGVGNVPGSPGHNAGLVGITQSPGPGPPPGVICCFQPVYYIPTSSPPAVYANSPILVNKVNGNNNMKLNPAPKRKNYKNLAPAQAKLNRSPPPALESHYNSHPKLTTSTSYPDPISPPGKHTKAVHQPVTRTLSSNLFLTSNSDLNKNEDKERSENLMNYYFYDKHWRPRDELDNSDLTESNELDNNLGWQNATQHLKSFSENLNLRHNESQQNNEISENASNSSVYGQQKDLEVEAQIITLANGHRDLEIRLCYVTS